MQTLNNVPTEIEWRVYRGDTSRLTIQLKDDEGKTVTNAQNVFCLARRYPNDPEVLGFLSFWFGTTPPPPNSNSQGDATTGIITVDIPWGQLIQETQDPFAWGKQFYFDVQVNFQDSGTVTILKVKVDVESDVSRGQGVPNSGI
jgi:hypothetical protein